MTTPSPFNRPLPVRSFARRLAGAVFVLGLASAAVAADTTKRNYDVPGGDAVATLRRFSEQSGRELVYPADVVRGITTKPIKGEFTTLEALNRMLAGSNLHVVQDEKTGALAVNRVSDPNGQRTAPTMTSDRPQKAAANSGPIELEEVAVTGTRIRGLLGEAAIQPTITLTAAEIERTGATSLGGAFRYIPQISSYTEGQFQQSPFAFGASSGDATSTRVTASLRGAPAGGTLLLINGRRAPRNGQQSGQDGYDLSGIPLAAVERIEVVLDGASAIYGADAVGGVINVILKRNYRGTGIRVSYENTFDSDVNGKTVSLTQGFGYGKLSGMVTASWQKGGNLMWVDRDFLRTQDRRPWGGTNNPNAQIPRDNGSISLPAGNSAGLPASTLVTIPAGSNGTNKTAADYAANLGAPPGTDLAIWAAYSSPYLRKDVVTNFDYEIKQGLTAFAELRGGEDETTQTATPIAVSSISIPANAPGNVFGVPVTMRRYLRDQAPFERVSKTRNVGATVGLRGELPHEWKYEGAVSYTYSKPSFSNPYGFSIVQSLFNAALANPDPSRRPNLFYDAMSGTNPNPPGLIESLTMADLTLERSIAWTYDVRADGPIYSLWAGDIRGAIGAEFREEYVDFPYVTLDDQFSARPSNREVSGLFAEVLVPLLSEKQEIPFVHSLQVSAAIRRDGYKEFPNAVTPRYGAAFSPFKWVMLRASYGEGYKVPTLGQISAPVRGSDTFFSTTNPPTDPLRGGTAVTMLVMPTVFGGNPNLVPEESETTTAGVVLEVPHRWFKGLSLFYSYRQDKYVNRISPSLAFADRVLIFPELFTRGPNLPGDQPGWAGPIVSYDNRPVNVSTNEITGWDAGLSYSRNTRWGDIILDGNASRIYRNENRPRPGAPPATNAVPESLPLKLSGSLFWQKDGLMTGALFSYRDAFKRTLTERLTGSSIRWDAQLAYDFSKSSWARPNADRWWRRAFAETRLSLTVFNVFDTTPPMNSAGLPDSTIVDALGARYSISLTKSFGGESSR